MLVLTRKNGQEIAIDGDIRITIVAVEGDRVRVGIAAPPEVRVDRGEIRERVCEFAQQRLALDSIESPSTSSGRSHARNS